MNSTMEKTLTFHDRCDRCGAQGLVRVAINDDLDLVFCGHHFHTHQEALGGQAEVVVDHREFVS